MGKVKGVINQKGGIAKTTSCFQIGHELASRGKRILLIDTDGQRSLTKVMGLERPGQATIYALLTDPGKGMSLSRGIFAYEGTPARPIRYSGNGCLHLVQGAKQISDAPAVFERDRVAQPVQTFEAILPYLINTYAREYDYVFMDASPSPNRVSEALILAADEILAPVGSEPMAIDGIPDLLDTVRALNDTRSRLGMGGQTRLDGMLLAKVYSSQVGVMKQIQAALEASNIPHFGGAYIPFTDPGWAAAADRIPIAVYAPDDPAAQAYRQVAKSY